MSVGEGHERKLGILPLSPLWLLSGVARLTLGSMKVEVVSTYGLHLGCLSGEH